MWGLAIFGLGVIASVYLTGAFIYDMWPYNDKEDG